ncbi:MAG TPA: bifunctional ADP-heptose synthase [Candidatus Methylomirabilis sp.]|nr:bifunctional ADP-heptose synthase [Candidatus Methylomirabilis sp.]
MANAVDDAFPQDARRFLEAFKRRHSLAEVEAGLAALRKLRVLVVGEAIIDEYSYCTPLGKSPKEAIVSTKHLRRETHAGGALACANHVAGFCEVVHLVTGLGGDDTREAFVRERLKPNVAPRFFVRPGAPTITKRRYIWEPFLVRLFEVDFMDDSPWPAPLEEEMLRHLRESVPTYDVVVVADYGHGFLGERVATLLAERARFLAVNTQANAANLGFHIVTKYPRASYVCIDEPELRLATRDRWGSVEELADKVRAHLGGPAIAVTRGRLGALVSGADGAWWTVPIFSQAVVDRMGAGDAFLSVTAPCVASGMSMDMAGLLGSAVGALAVGIVGNRSAIEPGALTRFVTDLLT